MDLRTIQLPELSPGPAGPETHFEYHTEVEVLGDHSTMRCLFSSLSLSLFKQDINLSSVDTGISYPLFPATRKSTSLTSFWKLWVSLIGAHVTVLCAVTSCRLASWMTVISWANDGCKDLTILKKKKRKKKLRRATSTHSC